MVQTNTVLILGAGASMPYDFPSGNQLRLDVCEALKYKPPSKYIIKENPIKVSSIYIPKTYGVDEPYIDDTKSANHLFQLLLDAGINKIEIEKFSYHLLESDLDSIDLFIEKRPQFELIGKAAMAYVLLGYESKNSISADSDQHWYRFLWNQLSTSTIAGFNQNRVRILTFNYDRSLEKYLYDKLLYTYDKNHDEILKALRHVPVIHLHGRIGGLHGNWNDFAIAYGGKIESGVDLQRSANLINVIHNEKNKDDFDKANEFINEAQNIFFLGFGFSEHNLRKFKQENFHGKNMYATKLGLPNSIANRAAGYFSHNINMQPLNCYQLISEVGL